MAKFRMVKLSELSSDLSLSATHYLEQCEKNERIAEEGTLLREPQPKENAVFWLEFFGPHNDAARHIAVRHPEHPPRRFVVFYGNDMKRGTCFEITNLFDYTLDQLVDHLDDNELVLARSDSEEAGCSFNNRIMLHALYLEQSIAEFKLQDGVG